jgi:peptide deformylase
MIYPIVKYPDPILETPCADVTEFDEELAKLVDDMFESMYAAHGLGLAAPQIGIGKRITVIDCSQDEEDEAKKTQKIALINPTIIEHEGRQNGEEGCLSLPDIREKVTRARCVRVRAQDVKGEWFEFDAEELYARACQHEIDHLNGILFIQHLSGLKRDLIKRRIKKMIREGNW